MTSHPLRVLVVDDEVPALEEMTFLLGRDQRIAEVLTAGSGAEALRVLEDEHVDAIFLDVAMPGLSGLDLARVLARFRSPPPVVFVTAHDDHAVDAFELHAVDYLLKPVREERLAEAVRRVVRATTGGEEPSDEDETIAVELGGVTRFVSRSHIRYVEAQGDYARLHTDEGSHLVRIPLSTLEERWKNAGFLRIHRSLLVSIDHIDELRSDHGRTSVVIEGTTLQVARRHTRHLRDVLVRQAGLSPGSAERGAGA